MIPVVEYPGTKGILLTYSTGCFDHIGSNDLVLRPVSSLDKNVRQKLRNDVQWVIFIEDDDAIHKAEAGENLDPLLHRHDRSPFSLDRLHGPIAVHGYHEIIAELSRRPEVADMSGVKNIETPIGENDLPPLGLESAYFLSYGRKVLDFLTVILHPCAPIEIPSSCFPARSLRMLQKRWIRRWTFHEPVRRGLYYFFWSLCILFLMNPR